MTRLPSERYLAALDADAGRILDLTRTPGALAAAVPACPGWTVADLVRHLGGVYLHKAESVRLGRRAPDDEVDQGPAGDEALLAWFAEALADIRSVVGGDPERAAYSWWAADQTVGFWARRMAQETLVHRVDVEQALGLAPDVDEALAADGVDEVLVAFLPVWLPADGAAAGVRDDLRAHVAVAAAGREWDVRVEGLSAVVAAGPSGAVDRVSGPADALLLWAWGRAGSAGFDVVGEEGVAVLREVLRGATQ
ncbi:uncharacterized protein (TIGR03083 family) [Motilibacter rhizosphaerae]|uniref:Uncharacterized protein (TIGR03083 family) n=1 Tax=Motilibacter rhizosphaerae TaxID=598652 RepID=A0A4Q7NS29_9ACTN|nr:maleylpyruvate isomerase family mycothiol-dependent enzyme [Motilibacter rhizosphaerae]RZS89650.1 uncharacterized protein (TIGR03083 family) [Motilibacter rhizosphaerae]